TDNQKDAIVVPLTLFNGARLASGGVDDIENITLTYFSIGNGYYFCQLSGWLYSGIGDFSMLPENLQVTTTWNRGFDVPQRTTLDISVRVYINKTNMISVMRNENSDIPFSLDPITFIAKEVE